MSTKIHFAENVAENVAEMSPKCRMSQPFVPKALRHFFSLIWHSALKRGVVVAPLDFRFFCRKIPQVFFTYPFLTRAFPRDTMSLRKCSAQDTEAPKECQFPRGFFVGVGLASAFVLAI